MTGRWFGRWRRVAPWLWLACVVAVALHQWQFWQEDRLQTDLFALLPHDEREVGSERAMRLLADGAARKVVAMVGATTWESARAAAERFDSHWRRLDPGLEAATDIDTRGAEKAIEAMQPWRDRLLLPEQMALLRAAPTPTLAAKALATLHQPAGAWRLTDWMTDPLGLWPAWWAQRMATSPLRPREGWLALQAEGQHWIVLARQTTGAAFSIGGSTPHGNAIDAAERALRASMPEVTVLRAGVPLHAEAAAAQGSNEVNLIGWGSLAAVLALVWLGFRSLRPIVCIAISLLVGTAVALSVTALVFGRVHFVTLVFGASLVGVAEDFGIHYFASRAASPTEDAIDLIRRLWPGLALALATSVVGYAAMGAVPVPGLRQMAVFSSAGLLAAFLTVDCWFPALAGRGRAMTPLAERIAGTLRWRPSLPRSVPGRLLCIAAALMIAAGVLRLSAKDDVRALQTPAAPLMQQQRRVQQLLRWPSPGQFFLVSAASEDELLERERTLVVRLRPLIGQGVIGGVSALSDWVPPPAQQREAAELTARAESAVLAEMGRELGEDLTRPGFATEPLALSTFLDQPAAKALRGQWLGRIEGHTLASVVLVSGLHSISDLPQLARAAQDLPGVRWVDQVERYSSLLARYRATMSAVLVVGFAAVAAVLWTRFRGNAWRAWLPSALASLFALGLMGWIGEPLQLFSVLALIILLGIGVDYGIFLVEHQGDGSAWLAVVLGSASTLLSFGLLALSSTPALRSFGLTMAIGVTTVVLLSPIFLPAGDSPR